MEAEVSEMEWKRASRKIGELEGEIRELRSSLSSPHSVPLSREELSPMALEPSHLNFGLIKSLTTAEQHEALLAQELDRSKGEREILVKVNRELLEERKMAEDEVAHIRKRLHSMELGEGDVVEAQARKIVALETALDKVVLEQETETRTLVSDHEIYADGAEERLASLQVDLTKSRGE